MKKGQSPWAALLWSLALPGFGQLYNRDYFIAVVLITLEFYTNYGSHLNLSLLYTFHGDLTRAHDMVNYEHGLFYPSIWGFSMWQAYNRAKRMNDSSSEVGLNGPFFGLVAGMNIGLYTHFLFISPVYCGLVVGLIGVVFGFFIEKAFFIKRKNNPHKDL